MHATCPTTLISYLFSVKIIISGVPFVPHSPAACHFQFSELYKMRWKFIQRDSKLLSGFPWKKNFKPKKKKKIKTANGI
jgi:hypothetical protein